MKKILITVIVALFAVVLATGAATAQDAAAGKESVSPQKIELLKRLFADMKLDENMKQVFDSMAAQMKAAAPQMLKGMIDENEMTDRDRQIMDELMPPFMEKIYKTIFNSFDINKMVEEIYIPLYAKYFDEDDIKAMIAFYESPTGKKFIDLTPALTAEAMQKMMTDIIPQMTEAMKPVLDEFQEDVKAKLGDSEE
ncbi:MAG: DUF2059 domain-containing protein [bacterium]